MWRADSQKVGTNRHRVFEPLFQEVMNKIEEIIIIHVLHAVVVLIRKQKTPSRMKGMCMKYVACVEWAEADSTCRELAVA